MSGIDGRIFVAINGLAGRFSAIDAIGIFFAVYALPLMAIALAVLGLRKYSLISYAIMSASLAYAVNGIIGIVIARSRPFVDHSVTQLIDKLATSKSFPSDHAAVSFALASVLACAYPKGAIFFFVWAALIALSRVYVGVHYPADIVAGACVGIVSSLIVRRFVHNRPAHI